MTAILTVAQEHLHFNRALPAVMVLLFLWTWETARPLFVGRKDRIRHAARNLSIAAVNGVVLFFTIGLATTLLGNWTSDRQFGLLHTLGIGWGWRFLLAFLLLDAWAYLWERANHGFSFLWRFHRVHHSDHEMDCTTPVRFHFVELCISALARRPAIVLFGLEPLPILVYETVLMAMAQVNHANIGLGRWDRLLRWLIVTPAMHRIHHSRRRPETNSNFASVFSLWDRLWRTFRNPEQLTNLELGLDDFLDDRWHSVSGMMKTPFAEETQKAEERQTGMSADNAAPTTTADGFEGLAN